MIFPCEIAGKWVHHGTKGAPLLSDNFCINIGLPKNSDILELATYIEVSGVDPLEGLLIADDARAAAIQYFSNLSSYSVRVVKQLAPVQEKYCVMQIDGEALPSYVALLGSCQASLPTDMECLILLAIVQDKLQTSGVWNAGPHGGSFNWRGKMSGLAIVAEPQPLNDSVGQTIAAIFGLEDAGLGISAAPLSLTNSATNFQISSSTGRFSPVQGRLVFEATAATHPKWRFLSLYRILENSYLRIVKESLVRDFDADAGKAVEEAKKKLASEMNQLISLMKDQGLGHLFLKFNIKFEEQINIGNRYIVAVDRNAKTEGLYNSQDISVKAVVRFYKTRCSIAHAGTSSVIYEQHPDANSGMIALLPAVEEIIHGSLKITAS